jgi:hypothetical protein
MLAPAVHLPRPTLGTSKLSPDEQSDIRVHDPAYRFAHAGYGVCSMKITQDVRDSAATLNDKAWRRRAPSSRK